MIDDKSMSLLNALKVAKELGCSIEIVRRKGEVRLWHSSIPKSIKLNCRKKDVGRKTLSYLRKVKRNVVG